MVKRSEKIDPATSLKVLAVALAPFLLEVLGLDGKANGDDWLDVEVALPSCKRALFRACRNAELAGRRVGRRWLVRRADLDVWVLSHEAGITGIAPTRSPVSELLSKVLSPAEEHEINLDALRERIGLRRATDEERKERGLLPYDRDREYAEFLEEQKKEHSRRAKRENDNNDPRIAAERAAATRVADEATAKRSPNVPRVRCLRCGRETKRRKDGSATAHACPHEYGYGCRAADGDATGATPRCPWCAKERADADMQSTT